MLNAHNVFTLAGIRRDELLQQAEQFRLEKQAADSLSNRGQRASGAKAAVLALGARIHAMRKRHDAPQPIAITPVAPETV